jgi:hypothetical protein
MPHFVNKYSGTNVKYMKRWYLFYNEYLIKLHQLGGEIAMPQEFGAVPWRNQ